MGNVA